MGCFVCVHCHFYQPPRENPWLEAVESQDSAQPYHDWNERITAECYRPNAASRILDEQGRIAQIVNNYSRISFNFGPTLLSWLEEHAPETYEKILQADRESRQLFSGHGSAMAQAYNHVILPLANTRDKLTQVEWGLKDFQHRFKRDAEGMWLPETAVDLETLDVLSAAGIKFTVLSPYQANRMRGDSRAAWTNLHGHGIDSKRPYVCHLPSGRTIGLFFYDGQVARAVAFDKLLFDGANLARRLTGRFDPQGDSVQLIHIATDGETYGHHHAHGDMALAYALDYIEHNKLARITNYGEHFASHPPAYEVEILEKTSWSCAHGVGRWQRNCGCNAAAKGHWNQEWRGPLRETLDWLRDGLAKPFEREAKKLLRDPWAARDGYAQAVLDRSRESVAGFLKAHASRELSDEEQVRALRLLEMQRHLMLMYTSCGWFFDEPSGPETVQVLQYAGRAAQLGEQLFGGDREEQLLRRLEKVKSNLPEFGNGHGIYEKLVRPAMLDMFGAAAHYAISSLFDGYIKRDSMYCYSADLHEGQVFANGKKKLALGRATIVSLITRSQLEFNFGVFHFGDHNLVAGIRPSQAEDGFIGFLEEVSEVFDGGYFERCSGSIKQYFGRATYTLKSLLPDERQRIISQLVEVSLADLEGMYGSVFQQQAPQLSFLSELNMPPPEILKVSAQFVLDRALRRCLAEEKPDFERLRELLETAQQDGIKPSPEAVEPALRRRLEVLLRRWQRKPADLVALQALESLLELAHPLLDQDDLWQAQNLHFEVQRKLHSGVEVSSDHGWHVIFQRLSELLKIVSPASAPDARPHSTKEEKGRSAAAHAAAASAGDAPAAS